MTPATYTFFTVGYGRWETSQRAERLAAALGAAGVELLVDIRHSPCSAALSPKSPYGPTDTSLRADGEGGIVSVARAAGCAYLWLVELGNPQKNDPNMTVLRQHLAAPADRDWPVRRGLERVTQLVLGGRRLALLCACAKYEKCHRKPVAESLLAVLPEGSAHRDLTG